MNFVSSTFLTESEHVQKELATLTLHFESGMSQLIRDIRDAFIADCKVLYAVENGKIVAWMTCTDKPRFYWNRQDNPNRPEVQIFVLPTYRRQGLGRSLISQARTLWGAFSTCAWNAESHEFFRAVR